MAGQRAGHPFCFGRGHVSERFHLPLRLYGRDHETTVLLEAVERMVTTGQPVLVLIRGPAGIGKPSLVHGTSRNPSPHATGISRAQSSSS